MKRFVIFFCLLLGLMLLTTCQEAKIGTLAGTVTVGPLQPVAREGEVEPAPPPEVYTSRGINIFRAGTRDLAKKVMFDEHGEFRADLAAGNYLVELVPNGIEFSKELPVEVQIREGETTTLTINIDTGIR